MIQQGLTHNWRALSFAFCIENADIQGFLIANPKEQKVMVQTQRSIPYTVFLKSKKR